MADENTKLDTKNAEVAKSDIAADTAPVVPESEIGLGGPKKGRRAVSFVGRETGRGERGARKPRGGRGDRPRSDIAQSMISIRRVARVVAGGRRFSFSVAIVVGDRNGKVGVGLGKAGDTALAIDKAVKHAKKHMVTVSLTKDKSIRREVHAKYASSIVFLKPAPGKGLAAGGSVRTVLDLAGVNNINSKILSRSKNRLNNARAAVMALSKL